MPLRVYLVRHGQTDWNAERRLQGSADIALNEHGRGQAARLGRALAGELNHVYSSLLRRSSETAAALAQSAPMTPLAAFDEQALGIYEGRYLDGREPLVAEEYLRRLARQDDDLDGGESVNRHTTRVAAGLDYVRMRHRHGVIALVGHGATNVAVLRHLFALSFVEGRALRPANAEVFVIDFEAGGRARTYRRVTLQEPGQRL